MSTRLTSGGDGCGRVGQRGGGGRRRRGPPSGSSPAPTDADRDDTVSYSVDDARFTVDPDGTVRVAAGASFDAETEPSLTLVVTATSTDGSTSSESFAVSVGDVDEVDVGR
jgi:hypothetical protein